MALTGIPTNLVQKAWAKDLWKSVEKTLYWNKFIGTGADSIITKKVELSKQAGDRIIIPLMARLIGSGVTGDNLLEGNEEPLAFFDFAVTVDQIRNGVRIKGKMEEQKTQIDLRTAGKEGLATWLQEYLDTDFFTSLAASPSTNRVLYGGTATAESSLTDGDKLTTALISKAKRKAQMAGVPVAKTITGTVTVTADSYAIVGASTAFTTELMVGDKITISGQERLITEVIDATHATAHAKFSTAASAVAMTCSRYLGARSNIRPVNVEGKKMYVMVISPLAGRDLRDDTDWKNAQLNANVRGSDNPLFSGAIGIWDNVIIHEHENVKISGTGAASANVAHNLFLGAQAGAFAVAQETEWAEDPTIDYYNQVGFATSMIYGIEKSTFNGEDFGMITIKTGAKVD